MHINYGEPEEPSEAQTSKLAKAWGARLRLAWLGPPWLAQRAPQRASGPKTLAQH